MEIEIPEVEGVAKLADLHPVKNAAPHVAGTFKGVFTVGHHRDGMFPVLEFRHQPLVLIFTQKVATNGRRIQIGSVELDQDVIAFARVCSFDALGRGSYKRVVDLPFGQHQAANGTVTGQLLPGLFLKLFRVHIGHGRPVAFATFNQPNLDTHPVGSAHNDFVNNHHGDRSAGQAIHRHLAFGRRASNGHPLVGFQTGVLVSELMHLAFGDTHQQDGFIVMYDFGGTNFSGGIEHHHGIQGFAGIGGSLDKVQGLVGVAYKLLTGIHLLDGSVAFHRLEFCRFREGFFDELASGRRAVFR